MTIVVLNDDVLKFPRIVCGTVIITLIISQPVKNRFINRFVQRLIPVFILEQSLILIETFSTYMDLYTEYQFLIWRLCRIIRIVISLSLCYPLSLCLRDNQQKFRSVSVYVCCLMFIGTIFDLLQVNDGRSGVNYIALTVISLFTLYQYRQLRRRSGAENSQLNNLIFLEGIMMIFQISSIVLLFEDGYQMEFFIAIKITIELLQLQKFYAMILMMIQLNPTDIPQDTLVLHIMSDVTKENSYSNS